MATDLLLHALGPGGADPEAVALVTPEDGVWSYGGLNRSVEDRADELRSEGCLAGWVYPITGRTDAESIIEVLALWRAGAVPAPLNPALTGREEEAARSELLELRTGAQAVLWTSGTSGRPRGVAIGWEAFVASANGARRRLDLGENDVWLASLSPAHIGGLALLTRALLLGSAVVAADRADAARTWALICGEGLPVGYNRAVTHLSLVPTQLARLIEAAGASAPPESFRCALIGGARAPTDLVDRALASGWPIALTYGMTEMTSQVATAPPALVTRKPGTVGRPLDGVELRIAEDGEILTRGVTLADGYPGSEEPFTDQDGWYATGDLGRSDADGDLWITGRRVDRIVTGGVTVDALEVEEALRSHPAVSDVCVVGVPDEEWGERVAAWIVPVEGEADPVALEDYARERLSPAKRPRVWHFDAELPTNANGKADRPRIRSFLAGA
jgi:o-succinylbenzoate---CoA ligase